MSPEPCTTLRCEADAWDRRAKIAKWAAEELDACGDAIAGVLAANYMGASCLEAPPVFAVLTSAISTGPSSWRTALKRQVTNLLQTADECVAANRAFDTADLHSAKTVAK